jgi:glycosyltransferase involved in cell wall biosynthesis
MHNMAMDKRMADNKAPMTLGIVVPCYNEEDVLPETVKRLTQVLTKLVESHRISEASRIWFVDDGSRDRTWELINDYSRSGFPVCGIKLSRNRGHQNAVLAGLFGAEGDALISIDADLQDDLNVIDTMVDHYLSGVDLVYGVRKDRSSDTMFKRTTAQLFYDVLTLIGVETIHNHADFRLMSRRAVNALHEYQEVNLYLRGIVPLIGFQYALVEYDRAPRFAGESKYPLRKMLALSLNAITSFSVVPLRFISLLGLIVSAGSAVVTLWAFSVAILTDRAVAGWASTVLPIYFLGGIQILSLGIIGEYVGKIYMEIKRRPKYFIDSTVRCKQWTTHATLGNISKLSGSSSR